MPGNFTKHPEVPQSYGACQVHQLVKFQKYGFLICISLAEVFCLLSGNSASIEVLIQ